MTTERESTPKRRILRWSLVALAVVSVAAIAAFAWHRQPTVTKFYTDTDTIKTPADVSVPRDILWQPPVKLSEIVNTSTEDYEPRISWDGLTLFFVRGKAGENSDIYTSRRTPSGWTLPEPLAAINSQYEDLGPEPSADGNSLYFYSDRDGGLGGYDLWVSRRGDDGWLPPTNLGAYVNSEYNDYGPALAPDGKTLYYASNRPQYDDTSQPNPDAWPATVREDLFHRTYDLYAAPLTESGPGLAQPLGHLNTPHNEGAPCVSPIGDFVYFCSDRPGGEGGFDIYRARCIEGRFKTPTNLGPTLNTAANELDPGLTHLGYAIYFSSDRPHQQLHPDQPSDYNLYYTSSREVFLDIERQAKPPLDWAALWRQVLPNLMWALLALLLLLLIWALAGTIRDRRLSLLARCLLASLMLHLLAMTALSFWKVTASVVTAFRERGEIRVALSAPARSNDIAAQIRGQLTEVEAPEPQAVETARIDTPLDSKPFDAATEMEASPNRLEIQTRPDVQLTTNESSRTEPDAVPPTPNVDLHHDFTAQMPTLALPNESQRIDSDEAQLDVQMTSSQRTPLARPVLHVPTSQPVRPAEHLSSVATLTGASLDTEHVRSMASAPVTQDATPQQQTFDVAPTPTASLDNLPALNVALPTESQRESQVTEAAAPRVAAAAAESPRQSLPDFTATSQQNSQYHKLSPTLPGQAVDDVAFAADINISDARPARETAVAPKPAGSTQSTLPRIGLDLPALEEAPANQQSESSPRVAGATPDTTRPPVSDYAGSTNPIVTDGTVALAPEPVLNNSPATSSLLNPDLDVHSSKTTVSTPTFTQPQAIAGQPDPLALDLRLPDELEPPANNDDPTSGRAPLRGRVTDADTGTPLTGATIRLDLPNSEPLTATTDSAGYYALAVPPVPDNFALSAAHDDYLPDSVNIPAAALQRDTLIQDFNLQPLSEDVVAIEIEPTVHHLGNDTWTGTINSQFQKTSEGRRFTATFDITANQLPPHYSAATITLLAKGVQCPHQIFVNGFRLRQRLDSAPRDGSFGDFSAEFPPEILNEGENTLQIRGVSCQGDVDDFEFVNIQIELTR